MCVDLLSNNANCGACGSACPPTAPICNAGTCAVRCAAAGYSQCGGACVDLQSNKQNCGLCFEACGGNLQCQGGECGCPTGTVDCAGTCADLSTSNTNCGTCGRQCISGLGCVAGQCL